VKITAGRLGEALQRLLPLLIVVAIATCGYLWYVQPRLNAYLRARSDVSTLRDRVRTVQASTGRTRDWVPVDLRASIAEFEARVSRDDKVPDVAAALATAVLDVAPAGQLRGLTIETGDRVQQGIDPGARGASRPGAGTAGDGPDLRMALFPYAVSYTPLRITFESTFEAIGNFMRAIRDLPTTVEIRSARLTRGLPLMKLEVLIGVYQRGEAVDGVQGLAPGAAAPAPQSPTAPRVAGSPGTEG
jgi:Tfp pilus assembly protein PilO